MEIVKVKVKDVIGKGTPGISTVHYQSVVTRSDGKRFFVSTATVMGIPETLAFALPAEGDEPTSWSDIAGGRYMTHEQVIAVLGQGGDES